MIKNCRNLRDEVNRSHNVGGVVYLPQSVAIRFIHTVYKYFKDELNCSHDGGGGVAYLPAKRSYTFQSYSVYKEIEKRENCIYIPITHTGLLLSRLNERTLPDVSKIDYIRI